MYILISNIFFWIVLIIALLLPIIPKWRKSSLKYLDSDWPLYDFFEFIDERFSNPLEGILAAAGYVIYSVVAFILSVIIALLWPIVIIGLVAFKLNKQK